MAATVLIRTAHGAGPTLTDVTSVNDRHTTDDVYYAAGTTNPIPIPSAGSNYSFWRHHRLDATVTPVTSISNLRWYTDGANSSPAGVTWLGQAANAGALAGYRQAGTIGGETVGTTGIILNTTNHTGLTGAPVDPFTFTSGAPKSLAGSIANPSTGPFGDYFVTSIAVSSATNTTGAITAETISWVFDET
jgi:hypothetical protein